MFLEVPARPPASVADPQLWSGAQALIDRHSPTPGTGCCVHLSCRGAGHPCRIRRLADRMAAASNADWPQRLTARIDALSCGLDVRGAAR